MSTSSRAVRVAVVALGTAVAAVGLVPTSASAATPLVVGLRATCPTANFRTISAAVAAASPGDTIKVCAGTYSETVTVDKPLTFLGAKSGTHARKRTRPLQESTVDSAGGDFIINGGVNDVTINGFTLSGAGSDAAVADAIEAFQGSSGLTVSNNIIRDNQLGINLQNPDGTHPARINQNAFINNSLGTTGNGGTAVFISNGPANNTSIDHNSFTGHRETAINFAGGGSNSKGLAVTDNTSRNDATFVVATNSDNALIDGNTVGVSAGQANGSGILDFGGNNNLRIAYNVVTGGSSDGTSGIRVSDFSGTPSVGTTVVGNKVSGRSYGIRLSGANTSAYVAGNSIANSLNDGIFLDSAGGSSGSPSSVIVSRNQVSASTVHDCEDTTTGFGSARTANTWTRNTGSSHNSSPTAICS